MAAPSLIGSVTGSEADSSQITLDVSSLSPSDGDLAVAVVAFGSLALSGGAPDGWTRITGAVIAEDVELEGELLFRFLESTDSEFTFLNGDPNDPGTIAAGITVYRGVESISALDADEETALTAGSTSHVAPAITSTVDDVKLIAANLFWLDPGALTPHAGMTSRIDVAVVQTGGGTDRDVGVALFDEDFATAGTTGTRTTASTNSGLSNSILLALQPASDERTGFDREFGLTQQRIQPQGFTAPGGSYVFVIGRDLENQFHNMSVGDFFEVSQTADFDTAVIVTATVHLRGPADMPPTFRWKASMLIDGVERTSEMLDHSKIEKTLTFSANISQAAAGDHKLSFKLELVVV